MTKNQKIILGVGAIALAYYLFKDKIKEVITLSPPKGNNSYSKPKQSQELTSTKSNDANFSNFSNVIPCERRFCPPRSPYLKYRKDGSCYCSETPYRTRTVAQTLVTT